MSSLLDDLRDADAAMARGWHTTKERPEHHVMDIRSDDDGLIAESVYPDDAAGIALMRNALPKLLAVVEAAQTYVQAVESVAWNDPEKYPFTLRETLRHRLAALEETP